MVPKQIGRYQIKAELGRGGMSIVYWAHDPHFERDVAIKLLAEQLLDREQFHVRFVREARTVAALDHPAIVPVYDFGEHGERPYLVMRFMTGGSLADRIEKQPLSINRAAAIMARLAPALDEAHAHGIIHRDLKPSNILFDQRDTPFISDFGIVKLTASDTKITETGGMVGTPAYMSPEQIQGNISLDGRSDIYTLGILLFEMLTADHPYATDTPIGVAVKHIFEPVTHRLDDYPQLLPACRAIIARAMAKNREDRYPTAVAFARAVQEVAQLVPEVEYDQVISVPEESPATISQRRALIISNSQYDDALLSKLIQPGLRPDELAQVLRSPDIGQFDDVAIVRDESTDITRRAISQFLAGAKPGDTCLIYVAGHAVFDSRGRLFVATRNTEHDLLRATAVPARFLADEMDSSQAGEQILILDCSYSNAAGYHAPGLLVGKVVDTEDSFAGENHDRVIITSNNSIQYIWGKTGVIGKPAPSQFSHYFIAGLTSGEADIDQDGQITLQEIFAYVHRQLARDTGAHLIQSPRKWPENQGNEILMAQNPLAPPDAEHAAAAVNGNGAAPVVDYAINAAASTGKPQPDATEAEKSPVRPRRWPVQRWILWANVLILVTVFTFWGGNKLLGSSALPTPTPAATAAALALPKVTSTPSPTTTPLPAPTQTPLPTATATPPPTTTPTSTATPFPTTIPTQQPNNEAIAAEPASIYLQPDSSSAEIGIIEVGATVEVLGRSRYGQWLYVYDGRDTVGYVFAPRFEWAGDFESLPIAEADGTKTAGIICPDAGCSPLSLDIYPLPGARCIDGLVYRTIYMRGQGGDGMFTYFWNNQEIAGPLQNRGYGFEVYSTEGNNVIGVGKAVTGDGQSAEVQLFISDFTCH